LRIWRGKQLYGRDGLLGVGKSKFYEDYLYHPGGDKFVPGTDPPVPRLKPIELGPNSKGYGDPGVRALVKGLSGGINTLRRLRDAKGTYLPATEVTEPRS
jgi:hypothetical protein